MTCEAITKWLTVWYKSIMNYQYITAYKSPITMCYVMYAQLNISSIELYKLCI